MSYLLLLFLPLLVNAKLKRTTLYIPLVHNGVNVFDTKVISPPVVSPPNTQGKAVMAEIYFGSPPVKQVLHLDTGSSLTWVQCFPCSRCFDQNRLPKYWPKKSKTYREPMCESEDGKCRYELIYLDKCVVKGIHAQELVTVDTLDGGYERLYGVRFGCTEHSEGTSFIGTGILGLGAGMSSIIGEFDYKFSFCLGRISDKRSNHNLIFGDGANIQGHPTVINITNDHYYFSLESIIVERKIRLDHPVQVLVDTGSTMSYVSPGLYYNFVDEFEEIIGRPSSYRPNLCYKAEDIEQLYTFDVGFEFAGGAQLSVNVHNIFLPTGPPGDLCLAIINNENSFSDIIIGVTAMQGHNLGYHLRRKTVYLQKQNCNKSKL
ncbi:Eukaryotic aspartyl protease family protein [Raphanus sativus]|nr:Eukaryotic aspartyl protease family protein [Raphanus sativus]